MKIDKMCRSVEIVIRELGDDAAYDERRANALNTEIGDQTVDTCFASDEMKWETGVRRNGKWVIVEQYEDEKSAVAGHKQWVEKLMTNPTMKLIDIDLWGFGPFEDEEEG